MYGLVVFSRTRKQRSTPLQSLVYRLSLSVSEPLLLYTLAQRQRIHWSLKYSSSLLKVPYLKMPKVLQSLTVLQDTSEQNFVSSGTYLPKQRKLKRIIVTGKPLRVTCSVRCIYFIFLAFTLRRNITLIFCKQRILQNIFGKMQAYTVK